MLPHVEASSAHEPMAHTSRRKIFLGTESEINTSLPSSTVSVCEEDEEEVLAEPFEDPEDGVDGEVGEIYSPQPEAKRQLSFLTEYLARRKEGARKDIYRLIGILLIAFASIACIACDKETIYFTSILTLVIGVLLDSPLSEKKGDTVPITPTLDRRRPS